MPVPITAYSGTSCWSKVKAGFISGFIIGMVSGTLLGGFTVYRSGFRGKQLVSGVGKYMLQGGGSFGIFMAIGTGIRC